jgi:hypothetical protein
MSMDREQESFVPTRVVVRSIPGGRFTPRDGWEFETPIYAHWHAEIDIWFDAVREQIEHYVEGERRRRDLIAEFEGKRATAHAELDEAIAKEE